MPMLFVNYSHKKEVQHTQITVGGNLIDYPGKVTTKTTNLTMVKCLLNSVYLNTQTKMHVCRSRKLLPHDSYGVQGVYAVSCQCSPG